MNSDAVNAPTQIIRKFDTISSAAYYAIAELYKNRIAFCAV
jgi:hypothetical protein